MDTYVLGCWVAFSGMAFDSLVLGGFSSALDERARLNLSLVRVCFVRFEVCVPRLTGLSSVRRTGFLGSCLFSTCWNEPRALVARWSGLKKPITAPTVDADAYIQRTKSSRVVVFLLE